MEDKNNNEEHFEVLDIVENNPNDEIIKDDTSVDETSNNNEEEITDNIEEISNTEDENTIIDNTVNNENVVSDNKDTNVSSIKEEKIIKKEVVKEKVIENNIEPKEDKKENQEKETGKGETKTTQNNNTQTVVKEVVVKKSNVASTIIMIIVFILLIGAIFAFPYINEYFESLKNPTSSNIQTPINEQTTNEKEDKYTSGIDVKTALNNIKDIKNYKYDNLINVYAKDEEDEKFTIKNHTMYYFNDTKYEVELNKTIADFAYSTVDYYEKVDSNYYVYQNDITTNEYTKDEVAEDKYNIIYNLFNNMISYLSDNYEIVNEKENKSSDNEYINITLKTNVDIFKHLSYETSRINNNIDISKLDIKDVNVELYFDKDKELTRIEFEVEDKNIYQDMDSDEVVESAVSKYVFNNFNEESDIILPSLEH